jgi:hypothetical protein
VFAAIDKTIIAVEDPDGGFALFEETVAQIASAIGVLGI